MTTNPTIPVLDATDSGQHHHEMLTSGGALNRIALSAKLHCLTGCAIGEVLGMVIGTALGFSGRDVAHGAGVA